MKKWFNFFRAFMALYGNWNWKWFFLFLWISGQWTSQMNLFFHFFRELIFIFCLPSIWRIFSAKNENRWRNRSGAFIEPFLVESYRSLITSAIQVLENFNSLPLLILSFVNVTTFESLFDCEDCFKFYIS